MKIGIVNDTEMAARAIAAALDSSGDHRVVWTARSGSDAVRLCRDILPDLVLMDLVMPGMNGAAATREIMGSTPTAILVVTASVTGNCGLAFEAMGAGALDVIATPSLISDSGRTNFLLKISQIGAIITDRHMPTVPPPHRPEAPPDGGHGSADTLVAIGCSAGGPAALSQILGGLDPLARAAIVIVQHIDARFVDELAGWLGSFGKNPLGIAADGAPIEPGHIYLAGKDGHLETHRAARFRYDSNLGGLAYQPSVDVFFSSVARTWRGRAMGAVLTGMGRDGAAGLQAMRKAGFLTIAQDEKSSALFGMPKAAAPFASEILPLSSIAQRINQWIQT
jgi:two-component system response regulator WspF